MKFSLSKLPLAFLIFITACTPRPQTPMWPDRPYETPVPMASEAPVNPGIVRGAIPDNVQKIKVALLLPLAGESASVGSNMMDAALMALSDSYLTVPSDQIKSQIILIPKNTGSTPAETAAAARQAIEQGASFIIGPLFSQSVTSVARVAKPHNINVLSFSNTRSVAGGNAYVFGFLPEQQIARMAEYAYLNDLLHIAVMAPNDSYGQKVRTLLSESYTQKGGVVAPVELYAPSPINIDAAVARLVTNYNRSPDERKFKAIFIADGGFQIRHIIESFKKYNFDLSKVKLLGTGMWDDAEIAKIPEMQGAWFTSSPPEQYRKFEQHFMAVYNYKPIRLASLAYDAVSLVAKLTMSSDSPTIDSNMLTDPQGYNGPSNGLFRLNLDGTSERKLSILEITPFGGIKVINPAPLAF